MTFVNNRLPVKMLFYSEYLATNKDGW